MMVQTKRILFSIFSLLIAVVFIFTACSSEKLMSYTPEPVTRTDVKFSDLPFYKPDDTEVAAFKSEMQTFVSNMNTAKSANEQITLITNLDSDFRKYLEMKTIARIRISQNVSDETQADYQYFTQFFSDISEDNNNVNEAIVNSKYITELEEYFGKVAIDEYREYVRDYAPAQAELDNKIADLQSQYTKLSAGNSDTNSDTYKESANDILTQLLTLWDNKAQSAGYDDYSSYIYATRGLDLSDVETYIENVKETILPVYQKLADSTASSTYMYSRCPVISLINYNTQNYFSLTNDNGLALSQQVIRATLDEAGPVLDYLQQNDMIDATKSRMNREPNAGYTSFLPSTQVPFIYMSTPSVQTMIHEFGHAFEFFEYPKIDLTERFAPSPENTEISSIGMEVLATSHYDLLYKNSGNANMFKVYDLTNRLLSTAMDCEFELTLHKNSDMTQAERDDLYNNLITEYRMNTRNWESDYQFFYSPFYQDSYALDYAVGLNLYRTLQTDPSAAKASYLSYVQNSTQLDYVTRLTDAGLSNPFDKQNLVDLASYLDTLFTSDAYLHPIA